MPDHIPTDRLTAFLEDLVAVMIAHGLVINAMLDDTDPGAIHGALYVLPLEAKWEPPDGVCVYNDGTLAVQELDDDYQEGIVSVRFPETAHGRLKAIARAAEIRALAKGVAP